MAVGQHWDADEIEALTAHRTGARDFDAGDSNQVRDAVLRVLRENADLAAQRVVNIALFDSNTRIALDASKWIVEQVGKLEGGESDYMAQLVSEIYADEAMKAGLGDAE